MTGTLQKIKNALTPGHHGTHGSHGTHGTHGTTGYTDANTNVATVAHYAEGVQTGYDGRVANTSEGPVQQVRIAIAPNCPAPGYAAPVAEPRGEVCQAREFVEVEDRPIVKERIERIVEHVPVEKRFVVETRPVAETVLAERANVESLGVTEREIERTAGTTCPTNDPLGNLGSGSVTGGNHLVANECTTCGTAGGVGTGMGGVGTGVRQGDAVEEMLDGREPLYNVPMKSH